MKKNYALIFESSDFPFKVYISQSFDKIKNKLSELILNQLTIDEGYIDEELIKSFNEKFKNINSFENLKIIETLATDNYVIYYEKEYFSFTDLDLDVKIILTTNVERIDYE
jgi:hypothetical protein